MTQVTDDEYYTRMRSALGDKLRVLDYVQGHTVLDVGCGEGALMEVLWDEGYTAFGADISQAALDRMPRAGRDWAVQSPADQVDEWFSIKFDTIICSSVLHEVFSYGNGDGRVGRLESLRSALTSIHAALKPGGRLIIRDGVSAGNKYQRMRVDNDDEVKKFLAASPFNFRNQYDNYRPYWSKRIPLTDRTISLAKRRDPGVWTGNASSLAEFAFTYTWGPEAFDREVQEYYGVYTLNGYAQFVQSYGFRCIKKFGYVQPGYVEHLNGKVDFLDRDDFPDTNAIWVYEKN